MTTFTLSTRTFTGLGGYCPGPGGYLPDWEVITGSGRLFTGLGGY